MASCLRLTLLLVLFMTSIGSGQAADSLAFESGLRDFKDKDYLRAIYYFNLAKKQGGNQNTIHYNLGVSHFKLKHYPQAEAAFRVALRSRKLKQLIQFNLGLVKLKQRQATAAQHWFKLAQNRNAHLHFSEKIARLAAEISKPEISKSSIQKKPSRTRSSSSYSVAVGANIASGHDSNVTQTSTGFSLAQQDDFSERFAFLHFRLPYVRLKLTYYEQDFDTLNTSDYRQLESKLEFPIKLESWTITPALLYTSSQLKQQDYQSVSETSLDLKYRFAKRDSLLFKYRYSDIQVDDSDFSFSEGTRQRFRVQLVNDTFLGQFRLRYDFEQNDRLNAIDTDFSPTRHGLRLRLKNSLSKQFKIKNELIYRRSTYQADIRNKGVAREDNRQQYQFNLYVLPFSNMELGVKYLYTSNSSNIANEDYKRRITQAYVYVYF